ncbi:helix-turn-helix domain-containing protein [Dactylosporangium sp. AC04546]|uniref:TetR/AcrR family transcriptional regulator n=1 Tax=Dactylosporangium sp. AC04546 TaxID=2862460 RepID=UPI001EDE001F|nr:TetR/AcrR family transcriptional regulator [Dactylosporangium sp. AC04546]WVK89706.1 helix-turn-helix domain-containing protein [Dactylosporangium sp. AC04546]
MQTHRRRRVPALAPDDRRAALVAATLPLLRTHGAAVTTRQIAEAAGVAEGTIFGVFPDKASLIVAALAAAFDENPMIRALSAIDPEAPLRERLGDAVAIMMRRFEANGNLMMVARTLPPDTAQPLMEHLTESRKRLSDALAAVIEPDRARLRRSPRTVARLLLVVMMTTAHMEATEPENLTPDDIVGVLLDGLLIRTAGDA